MHLHRTPERANSTSSFFGNLFFLSRANADIIIPGVHIPHWADPCFEKDFFKRMNCSSSQTPSIVSILLFFIFPNVKRQEQKGLSSTNIVQEPQSPALQPTFVPLIFWFSLKNSLNLKLNFSIEETPRSSSGKLPTPLPVHLRAATSLARPRKGRSRPLRKSTSSALLCVELLALHSSFNLRLANYNPTIGQAKSKTAA